jgi:DNA-binding CsgD family transcriptional regulator
LLLKPGAELSFGSAEPHPWGYRWQIPLTIALAMRGRTDEAVAALSVLGSRRHPAGRFLDYEYALARAWVVARQGAVTEGIAIILSAAETARGNGQFAPEVMCLQTATQFGARACAPRLNALQTLVEGPRVGLAARMAAALAAGDAVEMAAVSEGFEQMGDLIAAIDAAAHAAMLYRRQELRGSALRCSTRADALAKQCDASTPALHRASERLPITDREREIVTLLGQGMSNREVASRLYLSVRTVENHIYKAMAKTGTTSRDELAALLLPRGSREQK